MQVVPLDKREDVARRLESRLKKTNAGCLEWGGVRAGRNLYGYISINQVKKSTHRVAYELYRGPIPTGACVLHRCDNPICCNPEHLFLGTQLDNMRDMAAKKRGRGGRGEVNPKARLTAEQVLQIRASERSVAQLAAEYGVDKVTLWQARTGRTWKHLGAAT